MQSEEEMPTVLSVACTVREEPPCSATGGLAKRADRKRNPRGQVTAAPAASFPRACWEWPACLPLDVAPSTSEKNGLLESSLRGPDFS